MPKIDKKAHAFESADLIGKVEMKEYKASATKCTGLIYKPGDKYVKTVIR